MNTAHETGDKTDGKTADSQEQELVTLRQKSAESGKEPGL
jgi:hypothetical protein